MRVISTADDLRDLVRDARSQGKTIGFVPTMGALHEGHLSLVRLARRECGLVVVSIFVNPLQFSPNEDFDRYPRRMTEDVELLAREGADAVYSPRREDLYPRDFSTPIEVTGVTEGGEAAVRPGHFRGVATVVAKLFIAVSPDAAYFGRKDLQQVAVVRRLIRDLGFPIRLVVGETVRDADGLALSSRNAYLSPDERRLATELPRSLFAARDRVRAGERDARTLEEETRRRLEEAGMTVDYVEAVDPPTMRRVARVRPGTALAAAVRAGKTRLIDNVLLMEE